MDSIDAFTFEGYGLKLYGFSFLFIIFNHFVMKKICFAVRIYL